MFGWIGRVERVRTVGKAVHAERGGESHELVQLVRLERTLRAWVGWTVGERVRRDGRSAVMRWIVSERIEFARPGGCRSSGRWVGGARAHLAA